MAGDEVVEDLILAVEAMGLPEAAAAVDGLTASVDELAASMDRADVAVAGGAAGGGKKGLMGGLMSMKTLFAGLGIYEGIKSFASFQSQMEKLRTQTGATQTEVAKMSKGILSMAVSVGSGPQSLAEAMYHIESTGMRGAKALDALRTAAMGAKIGGTDLTETTNAMTAVIVAGFRGVNTLRQAMGYLNATVGAGDMTMSDLNDALSKGLLATMKDLGLQIPDTGAALAVFGDNNMRGSSAANALRMGLMKLLTPSKEVQENMAKLGLTHFQLAEDLHKPKGLLVMLEDLEHHLKGVKNVTERESITAGIFGSGKTASGMLTLMNQMDRLREKYRMVEKGGKNFNEDWKATTHTLSFFGDQIKALAEVALIKFGAGLDWVLNKIDALVEAFKKGKWWAIAIVTALGSIASVVIAVQAVTAAVAAFGVVAGIVAALSFWMLIPAAIAALVILAIKVKPVREAFVTAFKWVQNAGANAFAFFKEHWRLLTFILLGPFSLVGLFVSKHFKEIVAVGEWLYGAFKTVFNALKSVLTKPFNEWWSVVKAVALEIVKIIEWLVGVVEKNIGKVLGPLKSFLHLEGKVASIGGHALSDAGHFLGLAGGTPNVTEGGAFRVGEGGPEIVYLPKGAAVQSNEGGGSSGGGGNFTARVPIVLQLGRKTVARQVVQVGLEGQSCL